MILLFQCGYKRLFGLEDGLTLDVNFHRGLLHLEI